MSSGDSYIQAVGKIALAADGGSYGIHILAYNKERKSFIVLDVLSDSNERAFIDSKPRELDAFKASYRYKLECATPCKIARKMIL
jgi:hypothetical protein